MGFKLNGKIIDWEFFMKNPEYWQRFADTIGIDKNTIWEIK